MRCNRQPPPPAPAATHRLRTKRKAGIHAPCTTRWAVMRITGRGETYTAGGGTHQPLSIRRHVHESHTRGVRVGQCAQRLPRGGIPHHHHHTQPGEGRTSHCPSADTSMRATPAGCGLASVRSGCPVAASHTTTIASVTPPRGIASDLAPVSVSASTLSGASCLHLLPQHHEVGHEAAHAAELHGLSESRHAVNPADIASARRDCDTTVPKRPLRQGA